MSKTSWSQNLAKARQMKSKGMGCLYERINILSLVYSDAEFLANCESQGKDALEVLDREVNDICGGSFAKLLAVLQHFPDKGQWEGGNLEQMIATVLDMQTKSRDERKPRETVSWKQRYTELLDRFHELQLQHERALGRIEELERRKELAAA